MNGRPSHRVRQRRSSAYSVSMLRALSFAMLTEPRTGLITRSMYPM
jgi:hypothetical protein